MNQIYEGEETQLISADVGGGSLLRSERSIALTDPGSGRSEVEALRWRSVRSTCSRRKKWSDDVDEGEGPPPLATI